MKSKFWGATCLLALLGACSSGEEGVAPVNPDVNQDPLPISLNCVTAATRVTDHGYEAQDAIGLYVVNYSGDRPGALQPSGNHVDNMRFTYNSTWTPDEDIYWKDRTTKADFYAYFPYANVTNLNSHPFTVKEDQTTEAAYKQSEFLYGKAAGVSPTADAVRITTNHVLSCVVVNVKAGNGFTDEGLKASDIRVTLNGLKTQALIDLTSGAVSATGDVKPMSPLENGSKLSYKALVVPQTAAADNLVNIRIDGRDYKLKKECTFKSGKRHTVPVTVSKTNSGINVGVGPWEEDNVDFGGTAE